MKEDKKEKRQASFLELPTETAGVYLQRIPENVFESLCVVACPDSILNARVLYWFVKRNANLTYMQRSDELIPVSVSTNDLAKRLASSQSRIHKAIKKLIETDYLIKANGCQGKAAEYIVNKKKVVNAIVQYHNIFKDEEDEEQDEPKELVKHSYTNQWSGINL